MPHDVLRILIELLAWGDIKEARRTLPGHKQRIYGEIQDRLAFERAEIQLRFREEIDERKTLKWTLEEDEGVELKKAERTKVKKRLARVDELIAKMMVLLAEADERAQKERVALDDVEAELLAMFVDADQRKRYFAIVDMEEISENDYNLNIPRYVDTFESENEIEIADLARQLQSALSEEKLVTDAL